MRQLVRVVLVAWAATMLAACASAPAALPTAAPAPTPSPAPVPSAAAQPTQQPASQAAPGAPPASEMGVPGGQLGIGTAFTYDAAPGAANPSRVWFGVSNGAISAASYPSVAQTNLKSLGVLVTDGKSFVADEMSDAIYAVQRLDGAAPAFRVTSTDAQGRWAVVKEIVSDPQADTILFTVAFQALKGQPGDYRLFLNYTPRIGGSGAGDLSRIADGRAQAWDEQAGVYSTLASSPPPALAISGYPGQSDLRSELADFTVDTTYNATTTPGRLSIGVELPTSGAITVALSFGASQDAADAAAAGSLERGFAAVSRSYVAGWAAYLAGLPSPFPTLPLYSESLAVLKTLEDKTVRGAFLASLAVPWGQFAPDDARGYRAVRARDLYQMANALRLAGDEASAREALAFLDDHLQRPDGSFPLAALPDGTPTDDAVALDGVALPIVLAWQLGAADRYASLVQPAAEFILRTGPSSPRDRWGEPGGYSPATLAAEIAGLVCAADLAQKAGDTATAERFLKAADEWNASVERWTLAENGPLGGSYYLHSSDGQPNAATPLAIPGGANYDQRAIVDTSFLDLVRLGVRAPKDPRILATLELAEKELEVGTPKGEIFRRYAHDAYGEAQPGHAPDGHGNLWPLLVSENSIYLVAQSGSEHPASWYLPTVSGAANAGGMLPEQIFADGTPTGSAAPLGWAHAEYVVFALAVKQEHIPDTPAIVAQRYAR